MIDKNKKSSDSNMSSEISLERITEILDNCTVNIWAADPVGNIFFSNKGTASSLGLNRDELISSTAHEVGNTHLNNSSSTMDVLMNQVQSIRYTPTSNNVTTIAFSKPVFDDSGKLKMVVGNSIEENKFNEILNKIAAEKIDMYKAAIHHVIENTNVSPSIITRNERMLRLFQFAKKIAQSDTTILIHGESGTGKDVIARYIHQNSPRSKGIFTPLNCAAIPSELMESELFGYEKGAFSGARAQGHIGLLEISDSGTLFLDEVGEMPLPLQAKLLRVLETKDFIPVGGNTIKKSNARILAATNRNLTELVKEGKFREDLYYRLNILPITIPPLRDRKEDIAPLAETFLQELNTKYREEKSFTNDALALLEMLDWPGNIRELRNIVERISLVSSEKLITSQDIYNVTGFQGINDLLAEEINLDSIQEHDASLKSVMNHFEKNYITKVLNQCNGNVGQAAEILKIDKSGLYKKIKSFEK